MWYGVGGFRCGMVWEGLGVVWCERSEIYERD